jgi:hypothetical protein
MLVERTCPTSRNARQLRNQFLHSNYTASELLKEIIFNLLEQSKVFDFVRTWDLSSFGKAP